MLTFDAAAPHLVTAVPVTGLAAGETLAGIDVRPVTGQLFGLGVNAAANTASLYAVNPGTGALTAVGTPSGIGFQLVDGTTPVDLPDLAVAGYGFDFNPAVDRIRVTGGNLNFRLNPNTGGAIDGNAGAPGTQTDAAITEGTTTVDATAYTNGNLLPPGISTAYTLDATTNSLFVQNPPNEGKQTLGKQVKLNGGVLDFTNAGGFDLAGSVSTATSNVPVAAGAGYAALTVGGKPGLYRIDLPTATATFLGPLGDGGAVSGFALGAGFDDASWPVYSASLVRTGKAKQKRARIITGRVLTCPAELQDLTCSATVKVTAGKKRLGKAKVTAARGTQKKVVVKLSKAGKRFLVRKGRVKATVRITCLCGPNATSSTTTVRVRLRAAKL